MQNGGLWVQSPELERRDFPGGIHWFRVGAWDARTLGEMLAVRFGTPPGLQETTDSEWVELTIAA